LEVLGASDLDQGKSKEENALRLDPWILVYLMDDLLVVFYYGDLLGPYDEEQQAGGGQVSQEPSVKV